MPEEFHSSTHPPLPPTTEDERVLWLRLLRSRRVGVSTFYRLLTEHGSAGAALEALPDVASAAGMRDYAPCPEGVAIGEFRAGQKAGARLVAIGEKGYPDLLATLDDAPPLLWIKGEASVLARPRIALVGARNASSLGTRMARTLARELAEQGFVVVSGLARGIDTAAHKATVERGTIAVLGGGVDVIYPSENNALAMDILKAGLLVSEQPMGLAPQARHFPRRNRLVSGMSSAVVIVEAAAKSGSLITARCALDQGRDVMAVPGHPFDGRASGCNMLIRDGARLVRGAADVIEALGPMAEAAQQERQPALDLEPAAQNMPAQPAAAKRARPKPGRGLAETAALHQQILDRLGPSPVATDQLIRDLAVAPQSVAPVLLDLELEGRIQRAPGGLLSLVRATGS